MYVCISIRVYACMFTSKSVCIISSTFDTLWDDYNNNHCNTDPFLSARLSIRNIRVTVENKKSLPASGEDMWDTKK